MSKAAIAFITILILTCMVVGVYYAFDIQKKQTADSKPDSYTPPSTSSTGTSGSGSGTSGSGSGTSTTALSMQ